MRPTLLTAALLLLPLAAPASAADAVPAPSPTHPFVDLNGDGHPDLVSGLPALDVRGFADAGGVGVVYGAAGDVTGSGSLITQSSAGVPSGSEQGDRWGQVVAACDFDHDGFTDVAVGAPAEDVERSGASALDGAGQVTVLYGSGSGLHGDGADGFNQDSPGVPGGARSGEGFGSSLAAGDVDADGYCDLVVGAPKDVVGASGHQVAGGSVTLLRGSPAGVTTTGARLISQADSDVVGTAETGDGFGRSLAMADLDSNGYADLLVGAPAERIGTASNRGMVQFLFGMPSGLEARGAIRGVDYGMTDSFGQTLALGDFDGDLRTDVAFGSPAASSGRGAVGVLFQTDTGQFTSPAHYTQSTAGIPGAGESGDQWGAQLVTGDVDADGHADLAIAAPGEDLGSSSDAGAVTLLYGSTGGFDLTRSQMLTQDTPGMPGASSSGDRWGAALAAVDLQVDGSADLLVGSPADGAAHSGTVTVVPGGDAGLNPSSAERFDGSVVGVSPTHRDAFGSSLAATQTLQAPSEAEG